MKVLLVGSGGREHALAWKLSHSDFVDELLVWPGNPAILHAARLLDLAPTASLDELVERAKGEKVDFVVVGPEQPLAEGLADLCQKNQLPVFAPVKAAANLEASKAFAKDVMAKAKIPTAAFEVVDGEQSCRQVAMERLAKTGGAVIKASGLASGKGVFVCRSAEDIEEGLKRLYGSQMAKAAETVVIEDILLGRECSYFCMVGKRGATRLGFAVDFKRLSDGDQGPNTGGMGCYSPVSWLPEDAAEQVEAKVVEPLLAELKLRGIDYQGYLYVGLMWSSEGPSVVEFNVRLGDPEAQVLAVQDERDWGYMIARQLGFELPERQILPASTDRKAVAVVMASQGYPYGGAETEPKVLASGSFDKQESDRAVFGASVKLMDHQIATGTGRVLCVVACESSFRHARQSVYQAVGQIAQGWQGVQYRKDIAERVVREQEAE